VLSLPHFDGSRTSPSGPWNEARANLLAALAAVGFALFILVVALLN
jgi:hypothetical protein